MIRPLLSLVVLSLGLGFSASIEAGVWPAQGALTQVFIGLAMLIYWVGLPERAQAPRLRRWIAIPLALLPCYLGFQLIPLPENMLAMLSPSRLELLQGLQELDPSVTKAPLAAVPPIAAMKLLQFAGYIATTLLIRQLNWQFTRLPWATSVPLIAAGALEAGLGLAQIVNGPAGAAYAQGTFINRDHFSAMMEMTLPFALMYALAVWRRQDLRYSSPLMPSLGASGLLMLGAIMLVGITFSLSRAGFLIALITCLVLTAMSLTPRETTRQFRIRWLGAAGLAVIVMFLFLPPQQLLARFADWSANDQLSGETRLQYWHETVSLVRAYPWFGSGLGSFDSVFRLYQHATPLLSVDYAHNDYMQFLAELGVVGFGILSFLIAAVIVKLLRFLARSQDVDLHFRSLACIGSMLAILLHSIVDFSVQMPANAMVFAWVCGIAISSSRR